MRRSLLILVVLLLSGCGTFDTHLLFIEESHVGLKAQGGIPTSNSTGSAHIDFGYNRTVAAVIPKANAKTDKEKKVVSEAEKLAEALEDARKKAKDTNLKDQLAEARDKALTLADAATVDAAYDLNSASQRVALLTAELEANLNSASLTNLVTLNSNLDAALAKTNADSDDSPNCKPELADKHEPLSVISSFNSEVTWFSGTQVHTYFATGKAATQTACDVQAIKALVSLPQ